MINLDLNQQQDTQIGEDYPKPDQNNFWQIPVWSKRIWRISVLSRSAKERDYYRDSLIAMVRVLKAAVFSQIGLNMRHDFQAASGTDVNEWEGKAPGFYYADIMFTIEGSQEAIVLTSYGVIDTITATNLFTGDVAQVSIKTSNAGKPLLDGNGNPILDANGKPILM